MWEEITVSSGEKRLFHHINGQEESAYYREEKMSFYWKVIGDKTK